MSSWYQRNKATVIARASKRKTEMRLWFREYKKTLSCVQCGQNHPATLDFHHVVRRPDNRKLRDLIQNGTKNSILEELKRCVVLCSNCHRIHHWNERIDKHKNTPTIHIPTTYTGKPTMFDKIKAFFMGKPKVNQIPQYIARDEPVVTKPAVKPAQTGKKTTAKPASRKPVAHTKKPAVKTAQKRGK